MEPARPGLKVSLARAGLGRTARFEAWSGLIFFEANLARRKYFLNMLSDSVFYAVSEYGILFFKIQNEFRAKEFRVTGYIPAFSGPVFKENKVF